MVYYFRVIIYCRGNYSSYRSPIHTKVFGALFCQSLGRKVFWDLTSSEICLGDQAWNGFFSKTYCLLKFIKAYGVDFQVPYELTSTSCLILG